MTADLLSPRGAEPSRRRWQFSLRGVLLGVLALSIVLAIVAQLPRQAAFTVLMGLLLLFPLVVAAALQSRLVRWGLIAEDRRFESRRLQGGIASRLRRLLYAVGLWQPAAAPTLRTGCTTAFLSTLTLVGLWPALREIGLWMSLATVRPLDEIWNYGFRSLPHVFSRGGYWLALWRWELWSIGRWWLLFGVLVVAWLAATSLANRGLKAARLSETAARFLAFAPWLLVLEVAFLIGVWVESPNTVPEPSTGFVVGIFSWDLWHWDCWRDRGWLIRGAFPTWLAGSVFFAGVLRWRWTPAMLAALLLVPAALLLSVACTVAYQNGLPQLF